MAAPFVLYYVVMLDKHYHFTLILTASSTPSELLYIIYILHFSHTITYPTRSNMWVLHPSTISLRTRLNSEKLDPVL